MSAPPAGPPGAAPGTPSGKPPAARPAAPLVALPAEAGKPLAGRLAVRASAEGLESFDLLAQALRADEALRIALARSGAVRALVLAAARLPADTSLIERFAALKIPTLVLFGTRDPEVPSDAGRRWRALLPGCHIVWLYEAGPDLTAERPEAFAEIVLDFLSDPGAFLVNRRSGALQP
jgi:pimeloyl-ACP methyl ester carboxylesterase